jgi:cytochrome P450
MIPPKPAARVGRVSLWRHLRLLREDLLSAGPARLYRAWMAEFRTPFFRSYVCNDPALIRRVLSDRPGDFPKSRRLSGGLAPLLGGSVFVTSGADWARQRRIIEGAFEGGRLREAVPLIAAAGAEAVARMPPGVVEVERQTSQATADVIFRALFSLPIGDAVAAEVFALLRAHQRSQPVVGLSALLPWPGWLPRPQGRVTRATARRLRALIDGLARDRADQIAAGHAPDDLATRLMSTPDPATGRPFGVAEMADQVAIFLLAGHETSASALAWALLLLALDPAAQDRVAAEASGLGDTPDLTALSRLRFTRDVFRETLRLYPPVPMMVRETVRPERFRDRDLAPAAQVVLSPWHVHRHERLWDAPDAFDPDRWQTDRGRASGRAAYLPFSEGPRVCPGAGLAMAEGVLLLAMLVRAFRFSPTDRPAQPVAHLTLRSRDGIFLRVERRVWPVSDAVPSG